MSRHHHSSSRRRSAAYARTHAADPRHAGLVAVVALVQCGGSPSHPGAWVEERGVYLARKSEIVAHVNRMWPDATHLHGVAPCRLATAEEASRSDLSLWSLWQGRPILSVPRYHA